MIVMPEVLASVRRLRSLLLAGCLLACNGASSAGTTHSAESAAQATPAARAEPEAPAKPAPVKPRVKGDPQPTLPIGLIEFEAPAPRAPLMTLKVEVASTDAQRQMGMMFREQLGEEEGMLFVFPFERPNSFWMRNTLLPLDMLFIDSKWTVVGVVENAEPLTEVPRGVDALSQYVLEVNAGFAKRHGFGVGQKLRFVPPGEKP